LIHVFLFVSLKSLRWNWKLRCFLRWTIWDLSDFQTMVRSSYRLLRPHRNSCFYALLLVDRWSCAWQYLSHDFLKLFIWKSYCLLYVNNKIKINNLPEYLKYKKKIYIYIHIACQRKIKSIISVNSDINDAKRNYLYLTTIYDCNSLFQFMENSIYRNYNNFNFWL